MIEKSPPATGRIILCGWDSPVEVDGVLDIAEPDPHRQRDMIERLVDLDAGCMRYHRDLVMRLTAEGGQLEAQADDDDGDEEE